MREPGRSRVLGFLVEAHKRGVLRAALVSGATGFAFYQGARLLVVALQLPLWVLDTALGLILAGLLSLSVLGWLFVWTSDGIRRASILGGEWESPPRLDAYAGALVVGLTLFGAVLWWRMPVDGVVTRGAEVVAVLPFTVSGEGVNHLAEGLVDLLAINLNEVDAIRTANSRIVLRLHREAGRPGEADVPATDALAHAVGAGSVLTGSVTVRGAELELSATLRRAGGEPIAEARTGGSAGDVLDLVDSLSAALTDDVWRSRKSLPGFHLRSVTTSSSQALSHYLRGEALFRRGQWRAAENAFTRAVRADTTFALAYARLSDTHGWADGVFTESSSLFTETAHRLADQLPGRRRRLVTARWLADRSATGRASAADSLRAILERYPDDLEALHLLAEIGFRERARYGTGLGALTEPVERLLALDSTLTAGLIHPIETALQFGDRDRFERYLALAEAGGLGRAPEYRRVGIALWDDPATRGVIARELMADEGSAYTYTVGSYRVDVGSPTDFNDGLAAVIPLVPAERKVELWSIRTLLLTSTGRMAAAADTARLDVVPPQVIRAHLTDYPAVAGYVDPAAVTRGLDTALSDAGPVGRSVVWAARLSEALGYLALEDAQRARAALDALEAESVPAELEPAASGLMDASRGWVLLMTGDTAAAIERMQRGLGQAGRWTTAAVNTASTDSFGVLGAGAVVSFRLVAAMASWPETAAEGRRLLRDVLWPDFHYEVLRHYELARSLERAGEREAARASYEHFLTLLEGADEGLPPRREVARAREALDGLTREVAG